MVCYAKIHTHTPFPRGFIQRHNLANMLTLTKGKRAPVDINLSLPASFSSQEVYPSICHFVVLSIPTATNS
ncbi:hypothetical protein E2320_012221 [Naja naja]|nr:hypothetical protein E2320_012221 [Naja naja]